MRSLPRKLANKLRPRYTFAAVAILALAAGIGLALYDRTPPDASKLLALTLPDAAGRPQPVAQWQGKVVAVNFWATWCAPCREEMPEFVRAQAEYGSKGLQIVGIAIDNADKVRQFSQQLNLNYPALIGGYSAMDLSRDLGNSLLALPFTVVLDRQGKVAYTHLGPVKPGQFRSIVTKLL
ncbi:MAG TPA: TlpA disulfide reductase family protein [Casimicrobiaceae bacterium]|nr:TlpA disulfide reductase family protein [Casimicrobiaceae bacterium]